MTNVGWGWFRGRIWDEIVHGRPLMCFRVTVVLSNTEFYPWRFFLENDVFCLQENIWVGGGQKLPILKWTLFMDGSKVKMGLTQSRLETHLYLSAIKKLGKSISTPKSLNFLTWRHILIRTKILGFLPIFFDRKYALAVQRSCVK